jgi:hypothetical protein
MSEPKITVGDVSQVGIVVKDLRKAVKSFWETLGIGPWYIYTYAPPLLREPMVRGKPVAYSMKVAFANAGSVMMELIEPLRGPSIYKEFVAEKGEGLHHVHSRHENVRAVLQAFQEMGIAVLMSGKYGTGEFYYLDTEPVLGIIYEIVKKKPVISRVAPEATYPP